MLALCDLDSRALVPLHPLFSALPQRALDDEERGSPFFILFISSPIHRLGTSAERGHEPMGGRGAITALAFPKTPMLKMGAVNRLLNTRPLVGSHLAAQKYAQSLEVMKARLPL